MDLSSTSTGAPNTGGIDKMAFLTTFPYISETTIKLTNVDCVLLFPISGMGKHRDFKFDTWIKVDECQTNRRQ